MNKVEIEMNKQDVIDWFIENNVGDYYIPAAKDSFHDHRRRWICYECSFLVKINTYDFYEIPKHYADLHEEIWALMSLAVKD